MTRIAELEKMADERTKLLSAALDEIYALRVLLAEEASRVRADIQYKTYPKGRRAGAKAFVDAVEATAREGAPRQSSKVEFYRMTSSLERCGFDSALTALSFAKELAVRNESKGENT